MSVIFWVYLKSSVGSSLSVGRMVSLDRSDRENDENFLKLKKRMRKRITRRSSGCLVRLAFFDDYLDSHPTTWRPIVEGVFLVIAAF